MFVTKSIGVYKMTKKILAKIVFNLMNFMAFEFLLSVMSWAGTWGNDKSFSQIFLLTHLIIFFVLFIYLTGYFINKSYTWSVKNK